jgi:hypothetical protein
MKTPTKPPKHEKDFSMFESDDEEDMVTGEEGKQQVDGIKVGTEKDAATSKETTVVDTLEDDVISRLKGA